MASLIYVSCSTLDYPAGRDALEDIRLVSLARNSVLDITGLLIATPTYFAQLLEGDRPALDELMDSIVRDGRHRDVITVDRQQADTRRYPRWSMAGFGPSSFVSRTIHPVLEAVHRGADAGDVAAVRSLIHRLVPEDSESVPRFVAGDTDAMTPRPEE